LDRWIDLHIHSTFSDGSLTPSEIVARAKSIGLSAVALTDHDTCGGVEQFLAAGRTAGIETLGGVEISVEFRGHTVHILGYGIDPAHERLTQTLEKIVSGRDDRNERIIRKLQLLGVRIEMEEVRAVAGEQVVGRPHIAQVLINKGVVGNFNEAFERFLGRGRPAYCERFRLEPEPAIALISEAGGLAVLAHPVYIGLGSPEALASAVARWKEAGLAGIEAYYPDHSEEQTRFYIELAERFDLLITGGTDFHGAIRPEVSLGWGRGALRVPYALFERLCEALENARANRVEQSG